jgi:hypothetical protein
VFRRRPLRPMRRLRARRPIPSRRPIPEPVRKAMGLVEQGKFAEAAEAFERLAQETEERGMVLQAALLTQEAARCYLRLEDLDSAYDRGLKSLELFKRADRPGAARFLAQRMVKVLREKGRNAQAEAMERELEQLQVGAPRGVRRGELPGKCPQCGAPVREDEVEWLGPSSAECAYCGSVVKAG